MDSQIVVDRMADPYLEKMVAKLQKAKTESQIRKILLSIYNDGYKDGSSEAG